MKKLLLSITILCLSVVISFGQTAASYGFTPLTAPFTSIAATGTMIPTIMDDDATELSIPIGFTFKYCGTPYTELSACSNGWVSLNNSTSSSFFNSSFDIDGPGWLMPYWDDLTGDFFTAGAAAYYQTSGVAPNRVFTIEWNSYESISGFGDITFQIKLYETTNIIDFHYGTSLIFGDATIGISNDAVSDWQTLSDEGPSPTPLLFPLFQDLITTAPVADQVYRWTPACTLTPDIAGSRTMCEGAISIYTHDTAGGTWTSSDATIASINPLTGVATGVSAGIATLTYRSASGCFATIDVIVNPASPITGSLSVCTALTTTLSSSVPGGTWSSSGPAAAVDAATGVVTGSSVGTATITYRTPTACIYTAVVTVSALPVGVTGPFSLCAGSTGTMSTASPGGTWSSSFTSIATVDPVSGVLTGVAGGIATITYTLPSGCFRTTDVTINPLPAPITGAGPVCISGTRLLENTTAGGTWSSSAPGVATVDAGGLVTGVGAGTATITYTLISGCFRTAVVTVTAVVAPITGPTEICMYGTNGFLSNATPGGTWSSSDPAVAGMGIVPGEYTWVSAGTATITYTLSSGCFATLDVTVHPMELTFGIIRTCVGGSTTLTNATPPIGTGTWTSSDATVFTVGASTGVVTGVSVGTADVTYTMPVTGCFIRNIITVNPNPAAIGGILSTCTGQTTTLNNTTPGGTWSVADAGVATIDAATGVVTGVTPGTTTVTYTLPTECIATAVVTINGTPTGITGVTTLCPNFTTLLAHGTTGGTWSSSNTAVATVGVGTGVVTGVSLAGGTATITYTLPASTCVTTTAVTVLPAPAAIGGTLSVCESSTRTLTSSVGATWSSSNTAVATIGASTGVVTGIDAGTSTITVFGTNGCTRSAVVTVNVTPEALTGTASVCVAASTTLSSATGGGAWSTSNAGVATVVGGVVTGVSANTVTISYTLPTGCQTTRVVTVNAIPTNFTPTTTNSVCLGLTATLNSTPAGTWSSSNATVASVGASTGVITGNTVGNANITYTIANGCFRVRAFTVNALPAAIGGAGTVCPASTITLTNTSTPGTWSSSNTAVGTINTGTGALTGLSGGTTTVTYTLGTGCITTAVVTVIPAPIAAITPIGDTILCPGDFVTLTSSAAVGAFYQWFDGATAISGATSATYTTSVAGNYSVRVSVAAGCSTTSVPMAVTVVPTTATITVPSGTTTTCAGTAVVLNANTGVGLTYQWEESGTPIAGATASTYNALTAGTYAVRVTNSSGCYAVSAPVTITVRALPSNVVTVSGPLTFCAGNSVTLAAAAGNSYQWYNTAGPISGATNATYTATTSESYYAEVTNVDGCSVLTATSNVVVNALPNAGITPGGPTIFCSGGNVTLTAAAGLTYQWYRNGSVIAGATNASYLAALTGNYRVRVTNTGTGCVNMTGADTVVTMVSSPTAIPLTPAKFCWGGGALLSTNYSFLGTRVSYQWFRNTTALTGATNSTYNATSAGNYTCRITTPSACFELTSTVAVSEMPLPNPVITRTGSTLQTSNYFTSYQWYRDLVAIPGATSASTPIIGNGNYKVAVTDTNGCQSVSLTYTVTGFTGSVGVTDVNKTDIRIYPNPSTGAVHIECAMNVQAKLYSIDGRLAMEVSGVKDLNISHLADGVYIIVIMDEDGSQLKTERLVKSAN